jgi:predicted dehydrogenase
MPARLRAYCHEGKWHDIEVEDDVTAYVEYPNGATGTFVTTTADTPGTNRFEVTGDRGKLVAENGTLVFHKLAVPEREWNATYKGGFGQPPVERIEIDVSGDFPNHAGILRDFTQSVLTGAPLWAPGEEGIRGLQISNAMHLSSWLDRMVDVPVDETLYRDMLQKKVAASAEKTGRGTTLDTSGSY